MNKRDFVAERQPEWAKFQRMLDRVERGTFRGNNGASARGFSRAFRQLAHDLALVRSRGWGEELETYLNDLAARGTQCVLPNSTPGRITRFFGFLATGYPQVFRRNINYFWVAAFCLFLPLALVVVDYRKRSQFGAPRDAARSTANGRDDVRPRCQFTLEEFHFAEEQATMGGFYIYHNVGIALRAFGAGLLFGVITIYVLLSNGIMIGTIAGYLISQGHGEAFLSFVVSHGAFELTAIAIAGGAGLILGNAVLHPGQRTRLESLQVRGREAVQIAGGAVVMLIIAALIEAFWSPAAIPPMVKYIVGGVLWLLVASYLSLVGREVVYGPEILVAEEV